MRRAWRSVGAAASSGPGLTAVNFAVGDTAGGGQAIVLTGTLLSTVTTVTIGGASVAPTATTATSCTFALPAHAAGSVTVSVTSPGGTSNTLAFEYWTPAQLAGIDSFFDSNKGITASAGVVSTWQEQTRADNYASTVSFEPTQVASVFGALPSIRFVNGGSLDANQWVRSTRRALASGASYFWVSKWTATYATERDNPNNVPMTLIGDSTSSIVAVCGANAGKLEQYDNSGGGRWNGAATTLNNGAARLVGLTHATGAGNTLQFYNGATADGPADASAYSTGRGYDSIGASRSNTGTSTTGGDGWSGDVGAVVIVGAVMSGADIAKLHAWAQQRFNTL